MNLAKAKEILELNLKEAGKNIPADCKAAIQIGIEAMVREEKHRQMAKSEHIWLLPTETKD